MVWFGTAAGDLLEAVPTVSAGRNVRLTVLVAPARCCLEQEGFVAGVPRVAHFTRRQLQICSDHQSLRSLPSSALDLDASMGRIAVETGLLPYSTHQ